MSDKNKKRTFGLSVLTTTQANVLLPEAKKVSRTQRLQKQLSRKGVSPVVRKNVLDWHAARAAKPLVIEAPVPAALPYGSNGPTDMPKTSEEWLASNRNGWVGVQ